MNSVLMFDAAYPPPVIGGKEKQAHLLAKALLSNGVAVNVLSFTHRGNCSGEYEGVRIHRVNKNIFVVFSLFLHLVRLRRRFNILHIHTPSRVGKLVAIMGYVFGYKLVFKFPNEHILDQVEGLERLRWAVVLRVVNLFVVLEEDTEKKLLRAGVDRSRIFFASNGVEIVKNDCFTKQESGKVQIIFVGRLVPQKCCEILIRACSLLPLKKIDWSLKVVGDGPLNLNLKMLVDALNLSDRIEFFGYRVDSIRYMEKADILVLPSSKEGMSNVLLEAISIGLPIVATDVGAAKKLVGRFGEQFLCAPFDIEGLANNIQVLAQSEKLRGEYGRFLHRRGCDLFSIEAIAGQYEQNYRKLISR